MLKKLQHKFVILTTSITVVVLIIIAISINAMNYISVNNDSDEILQLLVDNNLTLNEHFESREHFPKELLFTTRFFVVTTDTEGDILYVDTKSISSVSPEDAISYLNEINKNERTSGIIDTYKYLVDKNDNGLTYVFLDIEEELSTLNDYICYSLAIVLVAILLIFILSVALSKKAVAPIANSYERQKGFITNVSHEFKTPLTIIKADCDVIEIDNGDSEWTDSIKSQISRLDTLVETLVSLTKLDETIETLRTSFSLSDAIIETTNEFSSSIKNSDLHLVKEVLPNITYKGDETFVRKLIAILIENAIKYSLPQTDIKVSLKVVANKKIFTIENSCERVGIGKHNDWFERFYRGDKSRNSETKGFGIGLSIAKSICNLHSAKISAESKTGKEVIISVIF